MEVTAVVASDHLSFSCPSCQTPFTRDAATPSAPDQVFPVACEQCGVTFSVRNPSVTMAATSPLVSPSGVLSATDVLRRDVPSDAPGAHAAPRFCVKCGNRLSDSQAFCATCGAATTGGQLAAELGQRIAASSADALAALRQLVIDPVSGLAAAYTAMGDSRAQAAGIALAAFFAIAAALGVSLGARRALGGLLSLAGGQGFGGFLKLVVVFLIFPLAMTAIAFAVRKLLRAVPPLAADLFTCGAAVAPLGVAILISGVLGVANGEVIALLLMFASTYLLLMLFAGLTRIGSLTEKAAAPTLPILMLMTAWLSKIVFVAILT